MAWSLLILHIDVQKAGDATLIIASNDTDNTQRSVLIDGGLESSWPRVHGAVKRFTEKLNVIICTHYDRDHMSGLKGILKLTKPPSQSGGGGKRRKVSGDADLYENSIIFDQGNPGTWYDERFIGEDSGYLLYRAAIRKGQNRKHVTEMVASQYDEWHNNQNMLKPPYELVGKDLLWCDGVNYNKAPANAPTLTCIAANRFILQSDGVSLKEVGTVLGVADREKNVRSLAFKLQFGNFKYYIGGDIEALQECGWEWKNDTVQYQKDNKFVKYGLMGALSTVNVMKASHHGSQYSSAPAFINGIKPDIAVISCGTDNQYDHPHQVVIDNLESSKGLLSYYLTGQPSARLGQKGQVAGVRLNGQAVASGDILIEVDEADAWNQRTLMYKVSYFAPSGIGNNPTKRMTDTFTVPPTA